MVACGDPFSFPYDSRGCPVSLHAGVQARSAEWEYVEEAPPRELDAAEEFSRLCDRMIDRCAHHTSLLRSLRQEITGRVPTNNTGEV